MMALGLEEILMRLSLCTIVRNEAENLPRCLESVRDGVDEIVVLDTGSTDGTIEIAQSFGAIVEQMNWPNDFSIARNHAMQYVTGDWVLVLDADEALLPEVMPLIRSAIENPNYLVINLLRHEIGAAQSPYSLVSRLFRRHPEIYFARPYHAMIDDSVEALLQKQPDWQIAQIETVAIAHYGYQADVIESRDKFTKARTMMEGFLANNPNDPYVCSKLGALYIQMGETAPGLKLLQQGLQSQNIDPNTQYELQYHLGSVYANIGDINQAATYYQQAIQQPILPKLRLGAIHNLATLLHDAGEFPTAQQLYEQVLTIAPDLTIAHNNLGLTLKNLGQFDKAIQHYQQAIELQPNYAEAYQNLGVALMKIGQVPDSLVAFQRAIELHEKNGSEEADRLREGLKNMGFDLA
jgi:tetratricopeptide (TPR) repeat protein